MGTKVLVGTTKGVFILDGGTVKGPLCDGWPINHVKGDPATGRLYAVGGSPWHGAGIWRSDDGETWTLAKLASGMADEWFAPEAPKGPYTGQIDTFWSVGLAGGKVYAGAKPANLFESSDGETWTLQPALADFPGRAEWSPGAAGLILHTIVSDPSAPEKMWIGISAAGVFATEDGGQSWERRNRASNAEAAQHEGHDHDPSEVGHCVHNMVRAPGKGDVMYQQNHHGVFRSQDGGRSWDDISAGLPSTFGFPIAVHPSDPLKIWTLPLNGDSLGRFPPGASAAVWHSADGGQSWQRQGNGLPQENCFFTVLRQAMATDATGGVWFGTNSGSVFGTTDGGASWQEVARHLPTVLSVETLTR